MKPRLLPFVCAAISGFAGYRLWELGAEKWAIGLIIAYLNWLYANEWEK